MNGETHSSLFKGWKNKTQAVKGATYLSACIFQAVLAALLFVCAFLFFFDEETGYFDSGVFVPSVAWAALAVFSLWAVSSAFFMKNKELPSVIPYNGKASYFISEYIGFISAFDGLYRIKLLAGVYQEYKQYFDKTIYEYSKYKLYRISFIMDVATVVFCLGTAVYFFLLAKNTKRSDLKVLFGFFPVLRALSGVAQVYFEPKIAMNTPAKMLIEFSMMAIALFFLAEIRYLLNEKYAKPSLYAATGLVGMIVTLSAGLPLLVFYFRYNDYYSTTDLAEGYGEICLEAFFCVNIFLYIIMRAITFLRTSPEKATDGYKEETADSEEEAGCTEEDNSCPEEEMTETEEKGTEETLKNEEPEETAEAADDSHENS